MLILVAALLFAGIALFAAVAALRSKVLEFKFAFLITALLLSANGLLCLAVAWLRDIAVALR